MTYMGRLSCPLQCSRVPGNSGCSGQASEVIIRHPESSQPTGETPRQAGLVPFVSMFRVPMTALSIPTFALASIGRATQPRIRSQRSRMGMRSRTLGRHRAAILPRSRHASEFSGRPSFSCAMHGDIRSRNVGQSDRATGMHSQYTHTAAARRLPKASEGMVKRALECWKAKKVGRRSP